jgi:hypothetical protein
LSLDLGKWVVEWMQLPWRISEKSTEADWLKKKVGAIS